MRLRAVRARDVEALTAWLPGVAGTAGCKRWADVDAYDRAISDPGVLLAEDDAGVAFLDCATDARTATVRLLAVPPNIRRLGTGGRAAVALEHRLRRSVRQIYVQVPEELGLALYFWLRLGYRPLLQSDWPATPRTGGGAWLARNL